MAQCSDLKYVKFSLESAKDSKAHVTAITCGVSTDDALVAIGLATETLKELFPGGIKVKSVNVSHYSHD